MQRLAHLRAAAGLLGLHLRAAAATALGLELLAAARQPQHIADDGQHDEQQHDEHNGIREKGAQVAADVRPLRHGDIDRRDKLDCAVDRAVIRHRELADLVPRLDGGFERFAVALGIERDLLLKLRRAARIGRRQHGRDALRRADGHAVTVAPIAHGHFADEVARADDIAPAVVGKHPAVGRERVGKAAEIGRAVGAGRALAAEHDAQQAHAVLLRRGDEAVARGIGVAGLDALGVFVIIAAVHRGLGIDEAVRVRERALVGQVRGRDGVLDRVADRGEELMAERFFRDAVEVMRRGVMIVVRQAVGVNKVRARAAEGLRALVHALHEGRDAAADILRDDVARLVGRGDHGAVEKVLKRHGLADLDVGIARALDHVGIAVVIGGDGVAQVHVAALDRLDREQERHDLRQARGVGFGVDVAGIVILAAVLVGEQDAVGLQLFIERGLDRVAAENIRPLLRLDSALGHAVGRDVCGALGGIGRIVRGVFRGGDRESRRQQQADDEQQRQNAIFFHIFLHRTMI